MHYSISEGEKQSICCENRFPSITIDALQILGNEVDLKEAYDLYFGGAQAILLKDAEMHGGADSRRDGAVVGF
jgi:gamma-glutamyltranspeptidase/glutathione hydrolase